MTIQSNPDSTLTWRKSTYSGGTGGCVEVASSGSSVLVRDSGDRTGPVLIVTCAHWLGLLRRVRDGEAELVRQAGKIAGSPKDPGTSCSYHQSATDLSSGPWQLSGSRTA